MLGEVIGINGRGSFQDRGRVNVGLGYSISSNQVKNFLPELLATKLTEHATLDAGFSDRAGKVICSKLDRESPIAKAGLRLSDELLEFEGVPIKSANQFTNLICTLPEDWPAAVKVRSTDGVPKTIRVRAFGLPYPKQPRTKRLPPPSLPKPGDQGDEFDPEEAPPDPQQEKRAENLKVEMVKLLSASPGAIRDATTNRKYATLIVDRWLANDRQQPGQGANSADEMGLRVVSKIVQDGQAVGQQTLWLASGGRGRVENDLKVDGGYSAFSFDPEKCLVQTARDGKSEELPLSEARDSLPALQAMVLAELLQSGETLFASFGNLLIEGAGKSNQQLAWRVKALDFDLDKTYLWFSIATDRTGFKPQLVKAANDKNNEAGAVRFEDWRPVGNEQFQFPYRIVYVDSLSEEPTLRLEVETADWLPLDSKDFDQLRGSND